MIRGTVDPTLYITFLSCCEFLVIHLICESMSVDDGVGRLHGLSHVPDTRSVMTTDVTVEYRYKRLVKRDPTLHLNQNRTGNIIMGDMGKFSTRPINKV